MYGTFKKNHKLIQDSVQVYLQKKTQLKKKIRREELGFYNRVIIRYLRQIYTCTGIGKSFAFNLAKEGFNIILCARTLSKLQKTKQQIQTKHPSALVQILMIDFKRVLEQQYFNTQIKQIQDLDISILVNNVGVDVLDYYVDLTETQITDLIKINCFPVAVLNRRFIPLMIKRFKQTGDKSAIINVASMAGEIPMPLHNVYSASKVYVDYLSRALSYQYPNIDIISLRPSEVSTPMTFNKQTDILTILPDDCVEGLLNDIGYEKFSNGYWTHQLQGWLYSVLPECLFNFIWLNYIGPDFINERKKVQEQNKIRS